MPQGSLTTLSHGQQNPTDQNRTTALPVAAAPDPIWGRGANPVGAAQQTPSDTFSGMEVPLRNGTLAEFVDPKIPGSVTFAPRLKVAVAGKGLTLKTKQLFEGTVTEVTKDGFVAVLRDKTNPANPKEHGSFTFETTEISPEDIDLVRPGSSFYWVIGSQTTPVNERQNVSVLRFRRLPIWTRKALERANDQVRRFEEMFRE